MILRHGCRTSLKDLTRSHHHISGIWSKNHSGTVTRVMSGGCGADDELIWSAVLWPLGESVALPSKSTALGVNFAETARVPSSEFVLDRASE